MKYSEYTTAIRAGVFATCGQETEAGLLVLRNAETSESLRALNFLALTRTHLRLFTLGGRTGIKVKEELTAWTRGSIHVDVQDAIRCAAYASTGSSYDYPVHVLRIVGAGAELSIDVMAGDPADTSVLGIEQAQEIIAEVRQLSTGANTCV